MAERKLTKYGVEFDAKASDLDIELWCMRHDRRGDYEGGRLSSFDHLRNAVDIIFNNKDSRRTHVWSPWSVTNMQKMLGDRSPKRYLGIAGASSGGKCLHPNTEVMLHDGSVIRAGDVKVGDQLMGDDSQPRNVLETFTGRSNLVKIVPRFGDPWICNDDHQLTLKRRFATGKSWKRVGEIEDVTVKDYLKASDTFRFLRCLHHVGIEFPAQDVPLDPRMYGLWIGDGHSRENRITISDGEPEVLYYCKAWAEDEGYAVSEYRYEGSSQTCPSYHFVKVDEHGERVPNFENPFRNLIRKSWTLETGKRIDPAYLKNSREVRLELLAGIFDSDGHAANGTHVEIAIKHDGLKDDVCYLARSLGFLVSARKRMTTCNGKEFPSWRVNITGKTEEIIGLRKSCRINHREAHDTFKVEQLGEGDWAGFTIDGNHRFLLGDCTVTHNSNDAAMFALIMYLSAPWETKCILTSTTLKTAGGRIWKSVREYWTQMDHYFTSNGSKTPGKVVDSQREIKGLDRGGDFWEGSGIAVIAADKKAGEDSGSKLKGMKAPDVSATPGGMLILIADELPDLSYNVVDISYSNLSNNAQFIMIALGNPNLKLDAFGRFCTPLEGWSAVKDKTEWKTERGEVICYNAEENPRVLLEDDLTAEELKTYVTPYTWMPDRALMRSNEQHFGRNSRQYCGMYLGKWSDDKNADAIYAEKELMDTAGTFDWDAGSPQHAVCGLDSSYTSGGDRTVCVEGICGRVNGVKCLQVIGYKVLDINDDPDSKLSPSHELINEWQLMCKKRGCDPRAAGFDHSGAGIPFGHIVDMEWSPQVRKIDFGGKPSGRLYNLGADTTLEYKNRVSELWVQPKQYFRQDQIRGLNPEIVEELLGRLYNEKKDGSKLWIERKIEYKARAGKSCDIADAFAIMVDVCIQNGWLDSQEEKTILKRANKQYAEVKKNMRRIKSHRKINQFKFK